MNVFSQHFYVHPKDIKDGIAYLSDSETHHLLHVLRANIGDHITITDGEGTRYEGYLQKKHKKNAHIIIESSHINKDFLPHILVMGIIKDRIRTRIIVEKATELGMKAIYFYTGTHSEKKQINKTLLEQYLKESIKQNGRSWLPKLYHHGNLEETLIYTNKNYYGLVAHKTKNAKPCMKVGLQSTYPIALYIGPEGGFSDDEIHLLEINKCIFTSLGNYRLRSETAALYLMSWLHALYHQ